MRKAANDLPAGSDVWMAVKHIEAVVELRPGSRSGEGRLPPFASKMVRPLAT